VFRDIITRLAGTHSSHLSSSSTSSSSSSFSSPGPTTTPEKSLAQSFVVYDASMLRDADSVVFLDAYEAEGLLGVCEFIIKVIHAVVETVYGPTCSRLYINMFGLQIYVHERAIFHMNVQFFSTLPPCVAAPHIASHVSLVCRVSHLGSSSLNGLYTSPPLSCASCTLPPLSVKQHPLSSNTLVCIDALIRHFSFFLFAVLEL
jgi:hypothetical protein